MRTHSKSDASIQDLSSLPLFDWRAVVFSQPRTLAGQYLCRRFRISPGQADLIANLAGLGFDGEAR